MSANASLAPVSQDLNNLDYFDSTKFEFPIPGAGFMVVLDWGYPAHGKLSESFTGIKPGFVRDNSGEAEDFSFAGLAKMLTANIAINKVKEYLENGNIQALLEGIPPYARWFVQRIAENGELTPIDEFLLKSYMLYKTDLGQGYQSLKVIEFSALTYKLMITNKSLGQNAALKLLGKLGDFVEPEFAVFIKDMFVAFNNGFKDVDFENLTVKEQETKAVGYVFSDENMARACFDKVKSSDSVKDFKNSVKGFVEFYSVPASDDIFASDSFKRFSISSYEDFKKLDGQTTSFGFVGSKDFGSDLSQVKVSDGQPGLLVATVASGAYLNSKDNDGEAWIYFVGTEGSFVDYKEIIKHVVAAVYKLVEECREISGQDIKTLLEPVCSDSLDIRLNDLLKQRKELERSLNKVYAEVIRVQEYIDGNSSVFSRLINKRALEDHKVLIGYYKKDVVDIEEQLRIVTEEIEALQALMTSDYSDGFLQRVQNKTLLETVKTVFNFDKISLAAFGEDEKYRTVRENFAKRIALISSNFDIVKEYWPTIEYFFCGKYPELEKEVKAFGEELNAPGNIHNLQGSLVK